MPQSKKLLPLYILRILQEYTDLEHALKQGDILRLLVEEYSTECERKAVSRNIALLCAAGYEIARGPEGYTLLERQLDPTQTRLLIDLVLTSPCISRRDTCELLEKLLAQQSVYFRARHKHMQWASQLPHLHSPQLFYTLGLIMEAIDLGKKVAFFYSRYGADKKLRPVRSERFVKSPWHIMPKKGEYYLICDIQETDGVDSFRLEFISELCILDVDAEAKELDIRAYYNEHIYMMQGRSVDATLKVASWIIEQMFDWLGFDIVVERLDNEFSLVKTRANLESLIFFAMQYMLSVEVLEPPVARELVADFVCIGTLKYNGAPGSYTGGWQHEVNRKMRAAMHAAEGE